MVVTAAAAAAVALVARKVAVTAVVVVVQFAAFVPLAGAAKAVQMLALAGKQHLVENLVAVVVAWLLLQLSLQPVVGVGHFVSAVAAAVVAAAAFAAGFVGTAWEAQGKLTVECLTL